VLLFCRKAFSVIWLISPNFPKLPIAVLLFSESFIYIPLAPLKDGIFFYGHCDPRQPVGRSNLFISYLLPYKNPPLAHHITYPAVWLLPKIAHWAIS
jgi:hypothetical protein